MDIKDLWQIVLGEVELNTSRANFITWFKNTKIYSKKDGLVVIGTPNGFTKEWLENKYNKLIFKILRNNSPDIKDIKFIISGEKIKPSEPILDQSITAITGDQLNFQELNFNKETNLNPKYTFNNFVVGSFNELAQAAGRAIVKNPGTLYNPLFIYGGVGLGKTHLIQAIGNEITKNNPSKKVKYLSSERYTVELIDALSKKGMDTFKNKYHKIDTLIIDDIQFIAGKEKTQEEFFHTFNALYQKNKQIIITSDRLPKAISTLEERLRSRFEGGMIADIGYPDLETRLAILKNKIKEKKINIPEDVLEYIATNISKNIREIEGALNRIIAYSQINNTIPNIETTTKILFQIINSPKKITNCKNIIKTVAEFYNITINDLIDRSRKKELVRPRQITMYLIRKELNNSYPSIGEKLGGRDHTTVMYACQKIEKDIQKQDSIIEELNLIKEKLYS
ncbi:MAG: chromosomal replication initiator protein DnaA [Candidatus Portnoybacteria bacterium CG10_big_fil_rev_8_21_14_0_10_43_39]|uniref:Chromosomal replication initiator protein DnaA n=3 Tax=Candidatus Portnoyibacteriota TaxID=1817913 RepID=A0A2M8KH07_9BACT|nr:MAG: chromosomal replication initiator protein DnaA [Candidatus Portnoybacteria bacterium CG10_big_fil_rev_8_21_14_0_10_43_39]